MEMLCFSVVPPIGWKEIQLSPSERESQITQAGRRLREGIPNWQSVYPSFRRAMALSYSQAWDSGVRYAITSVPEPEEPVQIVASYMIAVLPPASEDGTDELSHIEENVLAERDGIEDDERFEASRIQVSNFGDAIQVDDLRHPSDKSDVFIASRRIFLPVHGKVLMAVGYTPQVQIADVLFELFLRITQTLEIWEEEE